MSTKRTKIRRQRPLRGGGRDPLASCLDPSVYRAVQKTKREYNCSGSWIVNSILRKALGVPKIEGMEDYDDE